MSVEAILENSERLGRVSPAMLLESLGRLARTNAAYRNDDIAGFQLSYTQAEWTGTETQYIFDVSSADSPRGRLHLYELEIVSISYLDEVPPTIAGEIEASELDYDSVDEDHAYDEGDDDDDEHDTTIKRVDSSSYQIATAFRQLNACEKTSYFCDDELVRETCTCMVSDGEQAFIIDDGPGGITVIERPLASDESRKPEGHDIVRFDSPEDAVRYWGGFEELTRRLTSERQDKQLKRAMSAVLDMQKFVPAFSNVNLVVPGAAIRKKRKR